MCQCHHDIFRLSNTSYIIGTRSGAGTRPEIDEIVTVTMFLRSFNMSIPLYHSKLFFFLLFKCRNYYSIFLFETSSFYLTKYIEVYTV